jgi:hypothetical protein
VYVRLKKAPSRQEVWLRASDVRAWLGINKVDLDDLVERGVLAPSGRPPVFRASQVARLAAAMSRVDGQSGDR